MEISNCYFLHIGLLHIVLSGVISGQTVLIPSLFVSGH